MFKQLNFPILLIHPAIGQNNVAGRQLEALFQALDEEGFEVLGAEHLEEGRLDALPRHAGDLPRLLLRSRPRRVLKTKKAEILRSERCKNM